MIGLVDYDLQTSTSARLTPPNIEIMKLATYYKTEENVFCRLVSLNEEDLTGYDKIYFFSEAASQPKIPSNFLRSKNVIYGGTAFTNGIYIPFKNTIIDFTLPKTHIYKEFLKQKYNDGIKHSVISHILDDTYYRCYAGEEQLPLPPILPRKRVFLYDKNFFNQNWKTIITTISEAKPSGIFTIHPIICHTLTEYCELRTFIKIGRSNAIILDLNIPLNDCTYLFNKYKFFFLEDIVKSSNIYLPLGGNFSTSLQYYKDYIYKMNLLYSFWSKQIPIKIYYIEPNIGFQNPLKNLTLLTKTWSNNYYSNKSLRDRIYPKTKKQATDSAIEWEQLLKFYPFAKDLIDQTYMDLNERRYWKI